MIARLFRRRSWVFGLVLSAVAFGLHALALSRGELALVQPVIVSGIVFAVLFRAALDRHLPSRPVVGWLILTWAGLALFVVVRSSRSAPAQAVSHEVAFVVVGVAVAGLITIAAGKVKTDRHAGLTLIGLDGRATTDLGEVDSSGPLVLVVGSEGDGLSRLVREACDSLASIPIAAQVESLNAGVAAGIALYEINRRR